MAGKATAAPMDEIEADDAPAQGKPESGSFFGRLIGKITGMGRMKMMIFGVETRPKGFDVDGVIWLVENWLMLVAKFRGPGEVGPMKTLWFRRHQLRPTRGGMKRSAQLVQTLKQFNHFLHPGERNQEGMYELYKELQTQMFELVEEFRSKMEEMNHKDLEKFKAELERVTGRVKVRIGY